MTHRKLTRPGIVARTWGGGDVHAQEEASRYNSSCKDVGGDPSLQIGIVAKVQSYGNEKLGFGGPPDYMGLLQ